MKLIDMMDRIELVLKEVKNVRKELYQIMSIDDRKQYARKYYGYDDSVDVYLITEMEND